MNIRKIIFKLILVSVFIFILSSCNVFPPKTYTITWKNYDGVVLEIDPEIEEGVIPEYNGIAPLRDNSETHTYTFIGWSPEIEKVSKDQTYTATFEELLIPVETYIITWKNYDGEVLEIDTEVEAGIMAEYNGAIPVRPDNGNYEYTFIGWR